MAAIHLALALSLTLCFVALAPVATADPVNLVCLTMPQERSSCSAMCIDIDPWDTPPRVDFRC